MSGNDVAAILARFDDFKTAVEQRFDRLEKGLVHKCETCVNAPTFKERLRSQWWHIVALWSAIIFVGTSLGGGLLYIGIRYFEHLVGK